MSQAWVETRAPEKRLGYKAIELAVASRVAATTGIAVRPIELPEFSRMDFALVEAHGDKIKAFLEVKSRSTPHDAYPTYSISLDKLVAGMTLSNNTGAAFILAIQWTDVLGVINWFSPAAISHTSVGGRTDRHTRTTIMAHIGLNQFKYYPITKDT